MARFYGSVQGSRGEATRLGHRNMVTRCASWSGAVRCDAYDRDGNDYVRIQFISWPRQDGSFRLIYDGPMSFAPENLIAPTPEG
jgi:hypothetical protein